jgi:hypothetical protein
MFSGDAFLPDNTFGGSGQLTISSSGYIAGNGFKISQDGSAEFGNLIARSNVDLGFLKKTSVTHPIDPLVNRSGSDNLNTFTSVVTGGFQKSLGTTSITARSYDSLSFIMTTSTTLLFLRVVTKLNGAVKHTVDVARSATSIPLNGQLINQVEVFLRSSFNINTSFTYSISIFSGLVNSLEITQLKNPTNSLDGANKTYVDNKMISTTTSASFSNPLRSYGEIDGLRLNTVNPSAQTLGRNIIIKTGVFNPNGTGAVGITFDTEQPFTDRPAVTVFCTNAASATDSVVGAKIRNLTKDGFDVIASFAIALSNDFTPSGQEYT